MHHQSQLADLVDVLSVDFDIVDRLGDSRKGYAQYYREAIEPLEPLALGKLRQRHPFLAIDRPHGVDGSPSDGCDCAVST